MTDLFCEQGTAFQAIFSSDDLTEFSATATVYNGSAVLVHPVVTLGSSNIVLTIASTSTLPLGVYNYQVTISDGTRLDGSFVVVGVGELPAATSLDVVTSEALPDQEGHTGEFLVSNGSTTSWTSAVDYFGQFSVSIDGITLVENNSQFGLPVGIVNVGNHTTVVFRVARNALCTEFPVSVQYVVNNGSTLGSYGFTPVSGTLSWSAGETADKTIGVTLMSALDVATDFKFGLTLSNPTYMTTLPTFPGTIAIVYQERIILPSNAPIATDFNSDTSDPQLLSSDPFNYNTVSALWVPKAGVWHINPLADEGSSIPVLTSPATGMNAVITTTGATLFDFRVQSLVHIPANIPDYRIGVIARSNSAGTQLLFCTLEQFEGTLFQKTYSLSGGVLTQIDGGGFASPNGWSPFGFDPTVGGMLELKFIGHGTGLDGQVQGYDCCGNSSVLYLANTYVGFGVWYDSQHTGGLQIGFQTFVGTAWNAVP